MPYLLEIVQPACEAKLTRAGFTSLFTADAVEAELAKEGTLLIVVNSVCGCAAGSARPGAVQGPFHSRPEAAAPRPRFSRARTSKR